MAINVNVRKVPVRPAQAVTITLPMMPIFFVFFILKMTGTVDWSWAWVTAPLWLPPAAIFGIILAFFFGILALYVVVGGAEFVYNTLNFRQRRRIRDRKASWNKTRL